MNKPSNRVFERAPCFIFTLAIFYPSTLKFTHLIYYTTMPNQQNGNCAPIIRIFAFMTMIIGNHIRNPRHEADTYKIDLNGVKI